MARMGGTEDGLRLLHGVARRRKAPEIVMPKEGGCGRSVSDQIRGGN